MGLFQEAIWDCDECLSLDPNNAKAKFRMAEAQYAIGDFQTALDNAQSAYQLWTIQDLKTLEAITELIGRCRKARWEQQERVNRRQISDLEREVLDLMQGRKEDLQRLGPEMCGMNPMDWETRLAEMDRQRGEMLSLFEATRMESEKKRPPPPDWALCPITLCVMTDPWMTPSGRSFDKLNLLQHVKNHNTCPISREPMTVKDIRPNIQLREACEEYLKNNGWAADY
jgi:STIP1 family protein 1